MAEETETGTEPEEETTVTDIPLNVDQRNQPIQEAMGQQATGVTNFDIDPDSGMEASLGAGTQTYTDLEAGDDEFLSVEDKELDDVTLTAKQVGGTKPPWWIMGGASQQMDPTTGQMIKWSPDSSPQTTAPTAPDDVGVDLEDVNKVSGKTGEAEAATGTIDSDNKIDINTVIDDRTTSQMLEDGTLAQTKTQQLAKEATTQYQLDSIISSLDGNAEMPAWASKNMVAVKALMNKRGLGSSSMAAAAMVQALMESAVPIAESDANRYATIQLKNLDNEQKTALHNATIVSTLDVKNLDNRMKAAKSNADAFLTMDIQNLKNEQIANSLTYKAKTDALFNDQAAENAAVNLNAKLQADIDKFYDSLKATVDTANANREAAMDQFNVDQENSMIKFEAKLNDSRDKFDSNMALLVEQSNALWRRNINTVNNAGENAVNQANAAALLGITLTAQSNLWQKYRDEASMAFTAGENDEQRALQLTLTAIANQFTTEMFEKNMDWEDDKALGALFADVVGSILTVGESWLSKPKPTTP